MRRLFCILLMFCLPLQAFAWQGESLSFGGGTHQLDHDNGVQHHHEQDGSVHYDDSDESAEHVQDGSTSSQPASLTATTLPVAPAPCVSTLKLDVQQLIPAPFLDGPHRPPASTLG